LSLVTLGVADVRRAKAFYEQLGWRGQEVERTVFFQAGGMALVLWGADELARDCGVERRPPGAFGGIALAHNVRSGAEVDAIVRAAEAAGATITRPPSPTFYGGYAGVFLDPDGHAWEIAHNPGFPLADDGSLTIPDLRAHGGGPEEAPAARRDG
jgi:catechol 2,3-dioxygenase-like lactoylglutathione lyase family enzyme